MAISFVENDKKEFVRPLGQVKSVIFFSQGILQRTAISLALAIELYMEGNIEESEGEVENALNLYDMMPKDEKLYDALYELLMIIYELKVKLNVDRNPQKALEYLKVIARQINIPKKTSTTEILDSRHVISSYYYMGLAYKNLGDMNAAQSCFTAGVGMLKLLIPRNRIVDLDMCLRLYYVAGRAFLETDQSASMLSFKAALNLFHKFFKDKKRKMVTKNTVELCIANAEALLKIYRKQDDAVSEAALKEDINVLYTYLKQTTIS